MKIGIITRSNSSTWGGDLKALYAISEGLQKLGHDVSFFSQLSADLASCDFALITNTCLDQRENHQWLVRNRIPYGAICFHEDFDKYLGYCMGFNNYVKNALRFPSNATVQECINKLYQDPGLVKWYTRANWDARINYPALRDAAFCVANSHQEADTIRRDCPEAKVNVVYWTAGMADEWDDSSSTEFPELIGIPHYLLQVGRLEPRKNQLGTLLACQDIAYPLVFIATKGHQTEYEQAFIECASRMRPHPTIVVTDLMPSSQKNSLTIVQMPYNQKLSATCLKSAYQHAKAHVHPAFYELPGYTYLESLRYNIPTVASSWASISEYLNGDTKGLISYATPYNLNEIKKAVVKMMEKEKTALELPIYRRTSLDVAQEIEELILLKVS